MTVNPGTFLREVPADMSEMAIRQYAPQITAFGLVVLVTAVVWFAVVDAAELGAAAAEIETVSYEFGMVHPAAIAGIIGLVVGHAFGSVSQKMKQSRSSSSGPDELFRESEYTEVVRETDDGYGVAVRDSDGGVDICSYNHNDEVYQRTWLAGDDLAPMADALSSRAVERERETE